MTKFVKPNFARRPSFKGELGVNPDFLAHDVRNELLKVVKGSALNPPHQEKLVAYANELAQMPGGQIETNANQRGQINKIASDAENLLASLRVLTTEATGTLRMYVNDACVGPPSPLSVDMVTLILEIGPADFMSQAWDTVEALKAVAEHASEQMSLRASTTDKPLEARQRGMIANLAARHYQMVGTYPPKDEKAWFARFARILGGVMELHHEDANAKPIDEKPFLGGRIPGTGIKLASTPYFTDEERDAALDAHAEQLSPGITATWCDHKWPLPLSPRVSQNCTKCGASTDDAPDR